MSGISLIIYDISAKHTCRPPDIKVISLSFHLATVKQGVLDVCAVYTESKMDN